MTAGSAVGSPPATTSGSPAEKPVPAPRHHTASAIRGRALTVSGMSEQATTYLGTIYLSANPGTPVGKFEFLVDANRGDDVEIGTAVAADTTEGTVIGSVIDMRTVGEGTSPVAANLSASYDSVPMARIREVIVATVQVLHSPRMRSVRAGRVRAATPDEMLLATGYHDIKWPIPVGVVPLVGGEMAKVCLDGHALLGPESAHLVVGGLSGVAAKSSFTGTLLKSAIHHGDAMNESVAAIVFNVKGEDLLGLDLPPADGYELSDEDRQMYEALGVPPKPFEDVTVYAPGLPKSAKLTRSVRQDALRVSWDLETVWPYLRYFFPKMDWYGDQILQAFLSEFADFKLYGGGRDKIATFGELEQWMENCIQNAAGEGIEETRSPTGWRGHHLASFRRFKRMLCTLPSRAGGLISTEKALPHEDIPVKGWSHGQVVVIDIAGLTPDIQAVVIARSLDRLMEAAEKGELGVDHLIISFDELNNFAPATGGEMGQVRKSLERVASMGRYLGLSLWGAGQALSKVAEQVYTNSTTRALGRTAEVELSSGAYGRLSTGLNERIATLPKGWMCVWHTTFRTPIVVRFPRPAWRTGKAKAKPGQPAARRPRITDVLGLRDASVERLLEGISTEQAERIIAGANTVEEAVEALKRTRLPDMHKSTVVADRSSFDPTDPFKIR
jgi:hypothetical protein